MDQMEHVYEVADSHGDKLSFCVDEDEKHGTRLNFWLTEDYGNLGSSEKAVIFLDLVQSRKLALAILSEVNRLEGVTR